LRARISFADGQKLRLGRAHAQNHRPERPPFYPGCWRVRAARAHIHTSSMPRVRAWA
jgi:hypothetical protein